MFKKISKCVIITVEVVKVPTRMEKYYGHSAKSTKTNSRSKRNKELYSEIFTYGDYTNISGVTNIGKNNSIDLEKVKELLQNQEKQKRSRRKDISNYELPKPKTYEAEEEKKYDIKDILKEAREHKKPDDKERVLRNTQYNILKNIDLSKEIKKEDYLKEDDELKELINTITNTSMINKINDADLAADLLSDLKANDTKVGEIKNLKDYVANETKVYKKQVDDYDKSFFTSSLKLNKSDFIDGDERKKPNVFNIILVIILILLMAASATIIIMRFF